MTGIIKCLMLVSLIFLQINCYEDDPNTFSNYHDVQITDLHLEWLLNLEQKYINATAQYNFKALKSNIQTIQLDVYQLNIYLVYLAKTGQPLDFEVVVMQGQSLIQGDQLKIKLSSPLNVNDELIIRVKYSIEGSKARALSFLTKEQTSSKTQPYMYSQCEDANCRSLAPLQDTPSVKQTLTSTVILKKDLNAYMTGEQLDTTFDLISEYSGIDLQSNNADYKAQSFQSTIPISSYLIAIVAGNVVQQKLGARTYVITEPTQLDAAAKDLEDLESYLTTVENYIGPYVWGTYKIVIQPPSFPIGGMENPHLTFASPTIITGDKSGVNVAIHEIAHSWTGNLVTCQNWANMWINEGFTVFLERKAGFALHGKDYYLIDASNGNIDMLADMKSQGYDHTFSSLHPDTNGINPDDSFTTVPYEKGFQFLTYLETFVTQAQFQTMLQDYIKAFQKTSISEGDFKTFLLAWIKQNVANSDAIVTQINNEWNGWVYKAGVPPVILDFKTDLIDQANTLAQSYIDAAGAVIGNPDAFSKFLTNQKLVFLNYLVANSAKLNDAIIDRIELDQKLNEFTNGEVLYRWFQACVQANYSKNIDLIKAFLGSVGRQKMIIPIYVALNVNQHDLAVQIFNTNKNFYHPLAAQKIATVLNIKIEDQQTEVIESGSFLK